MSFFNAFGYTFFGAKGTTSSTPPVAAGSLTRIKNLSNAGIQSSTQTQTVTVYDAETLGWARQIPTENSYTMDCTLNIDTQEASYRMLKECARDASAGVLLRWFRETPLTASSGTGAVEYLTIVNPSSGGTPGLVNNAATTTSGSGTGLQVDLTIAADGTASVAVPEATAKGTGYAIGDTITIAAATATTSGSVSMIVQAISGIGTKERHSGLAFVTNFNEDIQAGSIAACTFQLSGYGPYLYFPAV
jgi:hypothetical protein